MAKSKAVSQGSQSSQKPSPAKKKPAAKAKSEPSAKPTAEEKKPPAAKKSPTKARASVPASVAPAEAPPVVKKAKPRKSGEIPAWFQAEFPEPKEMAFLLALLDDPLDGEHREAYADWLEERGSPRGEFLRLQRQSETLGSDMLTGRLTQLRSTLSPVWLCVVGETLARVQPLVEKIAQSDAGGGEPKLELTKEWGLLDVHYAGDMTAEGLAPVLRWLASREIGPVVKRLVLDGHDDRDRPGDVLAIDLKILIDAEPDFPHLESLEIERGPGILAVYNDATKERGLFAKLLRKAPHLKELAIPSAPNSDFFVGPAHPLERLAVDAGADHQNMILNLSRATRFGQLRELEYQDVCDPQADGGPARCAPVDAYEALFRSPVLAKVERLVIRSASLSPEEIKRLRAIRKTGVKFEAADVG